MMDSSSFTNSLIGGALIGLSVTAMLLFNGRVTGISGIVASSWTKSPAEGLWRWLFIAGLLSGGLLVHAWDPTLFNNESGRSTTLVAIAGLLVGFGTIMGSGCTSGHGVCGISRFSVRSMAATATFMFFGWLAVQAARHWIRGGI